ncbi:MAG TPA: TonB family protein [Polyangiaceae bacterium]|nr:TonB family protein [Polyangiaceae bacterium]
MSQSVNWGAPSERVRPDVARFSRARNAKRQARRELIHARVVHPIDTPRLSFDPLERRESRALSALSAVRLVVSAVMIHVAVILVFAVVGYLLRRERTIHAPEHLTVKIVETQRPVLPPPVAEEPPVSPAPIVPEFESVTPPPKRRDAPVREPPKPRDTPSPAPEPQAAPRRIVGLSLESTVEGSGPAFATGTSRLGRTDPQAVDPLQARRAPAASAPAAAPQPDGTQRIASHIPTRDTQFEKPKRLKPNRPEFPAELKAQGIEGDVTVRVDIAASGAVTSVTIVQSSGYPAFDEAARRAAASERFAPAVRDGNAVPFSLSYSYRFRIED